MPRRTRNDQTAGESFKTFDAIDHAHPILDGDVHSDSVADGVTEGSIIVGNATPKWDKLAVGADGEVLTAQADGSVAWEASIGAHPILDGDVHNDSVAQTPTKGSLIAANATPKWTEFLTGADNAVLKADAGETEGLAWSGVLVSDANAVTGVVGLTSSDIIYISGTADATGRALRAENLGIDLTAGTQYPVFAYGQATTAGVNSLYGIRALAVCAAGAGTQAGDIIGVRGIARATDAGITDVTGSIIGVEGWAALAAAIDAATRICSVKATFYIPASEAAVITNILGLWVPMVDIEDAVVTNIYGILLEAPTKKIGSVTNVYGLFVEEPTLGGTLNEAIHIGGAGRLVFRDTAIHIESAGDGYLDLTADTGIRLHGNTDVAGDITTSGTVDGLDIAGHAADVDAHHAQAHKDEHDPEDGGDALDTASPSELASVQAAGTGSSHSLARADHAHQIQHSIADNHLATIDGTANQPVDNDYAKFTADGLEGRSYAEVVSDLSVAQYAFKNIATPFQTVVADASDDTVTFTAGTGLSIAGIAASDTIGWALDDKIRTVSKIFYYASPLVKAYPMFSVPAAATITYIYGARTAGTSVTFNIETRDVATPLTPSGDDVFAGDEVLTANENFTPDINDAAIAARESVWCDISAVADAVTEFWIYLEYTIV